MGHIAGAAYTVRSGLSRRSFIASSLSAAGGLVISISVPGHANASSAGSIIAGRDPSPGSSELNAWIVVETDDSVVIRVAKSEMGEGILTSLAMIVAEELGCDWSKVKTEYASANRNARENNVYQRMGTSGSGSIRQSRQYLQQAGASARERLIAAAAQRWSVRADECRVDMGQVIHAASKRSLGFGALAREAAGIKLDKEPAIKTPDAFTLIGTPQARLDTPVKVTGQAVFGIDVQVSGMVYAAVKFCPVPGGKMTGFDRTAVEGRRGVIAVVPIANGVAVVADRFWRAKQAAESLPVTWDMGAGASGNSTQFRQDYRDALNGPAANAKTIGDVGAAFAGAKIVEALYEAPLLAHATMEPLNCTAHVQTDRVDIWMGTQSPESVVQTAAKATGLAPEKIYLHNCYLGGGFGRRSQPDEMVQALEISKAVGRPVKLIWTRENDMRLDRYRPQAAVKFRATLGADGMPAAVEIRTAVGSLLRSLGRDAVASGVEPPAVDALATMPYAIPNLKVDCVLKNTHVPVMYWRSVGCSQNTFVLECFMDELAHAANQDPIKFRRKLLEGKPDFINVLDVLAEKSGWDQKLPPGKGRGMALQESNGTIVGEVVEVAIGPKGEVKVERVVAVADCGHLVNPLIAAMQLESGVIFGLTAALYGEITVKDGQIQQGNFDTYRMVRLAESPKIEAHFALSGGAKWGGLGEPGTPPVAPALCNAIFAATGNRIRSLPINSVEV